MELDCLDGECQEVMEKNTFGFFAAVVRYCMKDEGEPSFS